MSDQMPAWQKGIALEKLQEVAAIFKAEHKPLVFGAFGLVKEADVATAMTENSLLVTRNDRGHPIGAAIGKPLRNSGHFVDVSKREFEIMPGEVRVSAIAATHYEAGVKILKYLVEKFPHSLWVEIFEEDGHMKAALSHVRELHYLATKIAAGSEIKGIYTNSTVKAERLHPSELVSIKVLQPEFITTNDCKMMLQEIAMYAGETEGGGWEQHYSSYNKRKSWTAFALRGYLPTDPGFIIKPQEMAKSWKAENPGLLDNESQWTNICERFPKMMDIVAKILDGAEPDRVRLMRLAPGGELGRHADVTDRSAGVANGALARLHLPLLTSEKVIMHGWDKRGYHTQMNFPARALCYLDQRGPHRVENLDQTTERIHLVVDMHANERVRNLIAAAE